jgi:branched-chain amino acid transport system substrate-binding protein
MVGSYTYQEPQYSLGAFKAMASLPPGKRPKKVAILTAQNPFTVVAQNGYNGDGGALKYAKEMHMKVVFDQEYPESTTDFTQVVQKAKASGAQALIVLGLPDDSDQIAKTVKEIGWKPAFECMCGSQVTTLSNWPSLGSATNGVVGTDVAWASQGFPGLALLQRFATQRHEPVIPNYDVTAYAILQMLQQGVEGTHSLNQAKIRSWLLSHTVKTAVGTFKLNKNGTTPFNEILTQTIGKKQEPVWPAKVATAKLISPLP